MAGKRASLVGLADNKVEAVPGASRPDLVHLPPQQVSPTPLNPRRSFGTDAELTELGEGMRTGQLQPCFGVTRAAYIKLWPEHADRIPETCRVVLAGGERRLRAARHVKLPTVDFLIRADLAESREAFLAAVLAENMDRKNLDLIEQARGLQQMKDLEGDGAAAAKRLNKSKQWFSQNVGLLRLTEEMQTLVSAGTIPFRDARRYAALPELEQMPAWQADQDAARRAAEAPKPAPVPPSAAPQKPAGYTAVYPEPSEPAPTAAAAAVPTARPEQRQDTPVEESTRESDGYTAVYPEQQPSPAPAGVPEARTAPGPAPVPDVPPTAAVKPGPRLATVPVDDARRALEILQATMSRETFGDFLTRAAKLHEDVTALEA